MKLEYMITHRATGKVVCATPDSDTAINLTRMLNAAAYVAPDADGEVSTYCYSVCDGEVR